MKWSLFEIKEDGLIDIRDERIRLVPEFRKVLALKDGEKWFTYVHGMSDHMSIYRSVRSDQERAAQLKRDIFNGDRKVPDVVQSAIQRYQELQMNPTHRMQRVMDAQIEAAISEIESLQIKGDTGINSLLTLGERLLKMRNTMINQNAKIEELTMEQHNENMLEGLSIFERALRNATRN